MSACPACRASGTRVALPASSHEPKGIELVRCTSCGLVRLGPSTAPVDPTHYEYYAERVELEREQLYLPLTTMRLRAVAARLRSDAPVLRLLDVGCGEGQLVHAAGLEGWDACGIDLSNAATAIGRRFGLVCETVDVFSDALVPGSFGAVTMIELIEHVPDPAAFLARAHELVAPGGRLYLTTPNYASLGRVVLGRDWGSICTEHLTYFTPASLRRMATAAGFVSERVATKNLSAAALRRVARTLRLTRSDTVEPVRADEAGAHVGEAFVAEQRLRASIESSRALRIAKVVANVALRASRSGETIEATFRRPDC